MHSLPLWLAIINSIGLTSEFIDDRLKKITTIKNASSDEEVLV